MSKKSKTYPPLLWAFLAVILTNCVYYKTVTVPVNQPTFEEYLNRKPSWTITDVDHRTDAIFGMRVRNDSLFGKLSPGTYLIDHPENKQTYRKEKGERSKDYFHLQTNSPEFSDKIKIPISDITSATAHEIDKGKTIRVNVVCGILVILFFRL